MTSMQHKIINSINIRGLNIAQKKEKKRKT